jgi:DNA-binding protein H-NS
MAKSYEQLQRQIAELQAEAEELRQKEVVDVIARIRTAIDHYGISAADLGFGSKTAKPARSDARAPERMKPGRKPGVKTVAKSTSTVLYRDETGRTWVGRGKRPQWLRDALLAGRTLEDFKVPQA